MRLGTTPALPERQLRLVADSGRITDDEIRRAMRPRRRRFNRRRFAQLAMYAVIFGGWLAVLFWGPW